jgi:hypothetical protein
MEKGINMKQIKRYTQLIDIESGEVIAACELTPAAVKRIIKQYQTFGYYLKEAI